jgi:hypothetical protein
VLTRQQIENLPLVGNNILDLLTTLPGVRFDNDGNVSSVNGLGVNSINATRDGLSINDVRNSSKYMARR